MREIANDRYEKGQPDVRILCVQHYKQFRPGEKYTVEGYVAQQMIELHKAIRIKDMAGLGEVKRGVGRPRKIPVVIDGILH